MALALACVCACASALRMQMEPNSRKCLGEDLNKDVLVMGAFKVISASSGAAPGFEVKVGRVVAVNCKQWAMWGGVLWCGAAAS